MYTYETREIKHGVSNGAYSALSDFALEPKPLTGLRNVNFETSQDINDFYADNVQHVSVFGQKTTEGDMTLYQLPPAFMTGHLGYKLNANGSLSDGGVGVPFALQYIETTTTELGDTIPVLTVYYNVLPSFPTFEVTTDEADVTPQEISITCKARPNPNVLDASGNPVTFMQLKWTQANAQLFELYKTEIILPTTPVPVP